MTRGSLVVLGALLVLQLSACGNSARDGAAPGAAETFDGTLASAIVGAPELSLTASALKSTGLVTVFDGAAHYTVLAPDNDAFGALGEAGKTLQSPENSAAMAAILRDHILPGDLTIADIDAALKSAKGQPVKMRAMGGKDVSFSREGDALFVSTADGARAKVDGPARTASNGIVIPLDAVLRKLPAS